jgi:UDPglucose--hexose-1-phosphate uridylyltransferase
MSEFRQDPLSGRWVIVGGERADRPNEFHEEATRCTQVSCPFCAGNEAETPDAVSVYPPASNGSWKVRVVPNKYPAVTTDGDCPPPLSGTSALKSPRCGFGQHEVIIESPRHIASLTDLTPDEARLLLVAYRDRIAALRQNKQFKYVQIFKNVGPAAGASLEHAHSQLVALPDVPEVIQQEVASCREFYETTGRSLLAAMAEDELAAGDRIVAQSPRFLAFCPYASRFPYEVWLLPRAQQASFEFAKDEELGELSTFLQEVIGRIEGTLGRVAYNYFLHTEPFDTSAYDHYHWHIEIFPRLTKAAGFEWATGMFINPFLPEAAAQSLRTGSLPPSGMH